MFRSSTILMELVQSLAKVILLLKHSVKLRRCILCGDVAACRETACVLVYVLLGISPASEVWKPTFRNSISVPSSWAIRKFPKEHRLHSKHGESLKITMTCVLFVVQSDTFPSLIKRAFVGEWKIYTSIYCQMCIKLHVSARKSHHQANHRTISEISEI